MLISIERMYGENIMVYAGIKHDYSGRVFWFKVPKSLSGRIAVQGRVICKTKYGFQPGDVVELISCKGQSEIKQITGITPSRSVVGVKTSIKTDKVKITSAFLNTVPSPEKIANREAEYKLFGKFLTKVEFSRSGYLIDGYTAYLAAKKLGVKELDGFMMLGTRKKGNDEQEKEG